MQLNYFLLLQLKMSLLLNQTIISISSNNYVRFKKERKKEREKLFRFDINESHWTVDCRVKLKLDVNCKL